MYPSLDLTIRALNVVPTHRLRCEATPHDAGGGVDGLPVARVLIRLGAACQSLCPPGGPRGEWLKHRMAQGVAFTLGHLGALLVIREARWSAPAQPVQAIGAVGGGG